VDLEKLAARALDLGEVVYNELIEQKITTGLGVHFVVGVVDNERRNRTEFEPVTTLSLHQKSWGGLFDEDAAKQARLVAEHRCDSDRIPRRRRKKKFANLYEAGGVFRRARTRIGRQRHQLGIVVTVAGAEPQVNKIMAGVVADAFGGLWAQQHVLLDALPQKGRAAAA
jgi:hypothetical protein